MEPVRAEPVNRRENSILTVERRSETRRTIRPFPPALHQAANQTPLEHVLRCSVSPYQGDQVTVQAFEKLKPLPEQVFGGSRYHHW